MSRQKATVRAEPPPNLLYDMKAAARAERWARRAETWRAIERFYVFAGATAGLGALLLELLRCASR